METEKKIGVVIPVYNAKRYLRQCIQSVLNQTFQDFCLVLVDDGSNDGSGKICDTYAAKDSRICVIHQSNKGSVLARAAGVLSECAQAAKYICLCDADDTLEPDALRVPYEEAEKNDLDCVCAATAKMWKGIKFRSRYHAPCFEQPKVYTGGGDNCQRAIHQLLWHQQLPRVTVCKTLSYGANYAGNGLSSRCAVYGRRFEHNASPDA